MKDNPCLVDKKPFIVYTDNPCGKVEPENLSASMQEIIDGKAETSGYYPDLVAGDAFVDAVEDESAFTTRTSPAEYDGQARIVHIIGNSVRDTSGDVPVIYSATPLALTTTINDEIISALVLPQFEGGMKKIGADTSLIYDEITETKIIKRIGQKTIDKDEWTAYSGGATSDLYWCQIPDMKTQGAATMDRVLCDVYETTKIYNPEQPVNTVRCGSSNKRIYLRTDSGEEPADTITIYYQLNNNVETDIENTLVFDVKSGCTETVTVGEGTENALATFDIFYPLSVKDYIEDMPKDFISAESMENFIEALATELQTTITQTYDETTKTYTYTFGDANSLHLQPIDTTLDNNDEPMPINPDEDMR